MSKRFNRPSPTLTPLLLALAAWLSLPSPLSAQVVYRENFNNNTGTNQGADTVGWTYQTSDGVMAPWTPPTTTGGTSSSTTVAAGTLPNLGQSDTSSPTNGFFFAGGNTASTMRILAYTSEYTGATPLNKDTLQFIRFYQGNSNSTDATFRAALEIGGTWFISTSQNGDNVGNAAAFASSAVQLSFSSFTATDWFVLDTSNFTFNAMSPVALPSGPVDSFGFFAMKADLNPTSTTVRVDYFEVAAIPEPSTWFLLVGGLGSLALLRRRLRS